MWYTRHTADSLLQCINHHPSSYSRRFDFLSQLATYPTYTCITAYSSAYDYDQVTYWHLPPRQVDSYCQLLFHTSLCAKKGTEQLCTHAAALQFTGNPNNYTHVKGWSTTYYNNSAGTLKKYAWINAAVCTTAYQAYCEIHKSVFNCPTSPPPMPPPVPFTTGLCKQPCRTAMQVEAARLCCLPLYT